MKCEAKPLIAMVLLGAALPAAAQTDTRQPIISKMEMVYSMVSHPIRLTSDINFYDQSGIPKGSRQYAVPHLVYEPKVTLYNPYNTALTFAKLRIRIANPPVGFRFRKNSDYLRTEWNNGGPFHGLGRFQIANESNPQVQKSLTLLLTSKGVTGRPGASFQLQPGQSRTFMVWTEEIWTWGLETSASNSSRSFFDHDATLDRTNRDPRTNNFFGAEAVDQSNHVAGFQTASLSVSAGRPASTRYSFETGLYGSTSWVATKLDDAIVVEARAVDTVASSTVPDFQLSLMAGIAQDVVADTRKSFSFSIGDVSQPATATSDQPSITRALRIGDIFQDGPDRTPGGKAPFASFQLVAKSTALQQRKFQAADQPPATDLYEARLVEIRDFTQPFGEGGPSDHPTGGVVVTGVERVGNYLMLDLASAPLREYPWKVMGGSDPGALMDDLSQQSGAIEGPEGTGVYKLMVPVPAGSEKYFVQIGY